VVLNSAALGIFLTIILRAVEVVELEVTTCDPPSGDFERGREMGFA